MNWALAALLCVLLVELAMLLPFGSAIGALGKAGRRASQVFASPRISDHWKEKAMHAYACRTFLGTLQLALLIALVLGLAGLLVLGFEAAGATDFTAFLFTWAGMGFTVAVACLYAWGRKRFSDG